MLSTGPAVGSTVSRTEALSRANLSASAWIRIRSLLPCGPDRDAQGGRPQRQQEAADDGGEQQQSGGQHQKRGSLYFPAAESQFSGAGRTV